MPVKWLATRYGAWLGRRIYAPPRRGHHRDPASLGLAFTEEWTTTSDGVRLHLWVVRPPDGLTDRVAVVGHGIGLTKSAGLRQAAMLAGRGYAVVMYDHRNHGSSDAAPVAPGMAAGFTRDVQAAAQFAVEAFPACGHVLAYGFSFSSFPSLYALKDDTVITALVCDSGPALSIRSLFGGFAEAGAIPMPGPVRRSTWGGWAMQSCITTAVGLLDAPWPPPAEQGRLDRTPMLFIVGGADQVVPAPEVDLLAQRYAGASCQVLEGGHLDTVKQDPEGYEQVLGAFVDGLP